ncbi:MAG: alanine dehydrogenase [Porticoccaceae bacterium]|nr:alanine dehydrogenase [Porticoccaceae bacterium]
MHIGLPKERKQLEFRVGLIPDVVKQLIRDGHEVTVESGAGLGAGYGDEAYRGAGARVVDSPRAVFDVAELVVKVKEPQPEEMAMIRPGQALFTYLHLAADPELTRALQKTGCIGIAYETVTDPDGRLPLLTPMSQIAGRMATQVGAHYLEKGQGGRGVLMSGLDGAPPADVIILGGGNVGSNAARIAVGMGADVTIFDAKEERVSALRDLFAGSVRCQIADPLLVEQAVLKADLVIGSVLIPGASAPKVVSRDLVYRMAEGAVLVDVAIDQGGCFETSRPTSLADPVYTEHGVIHYCVTNIPSAVARTATIALNHITGPYVQNLANHGIEAALRDDRCLMNGVNLYRGHVTHRAVADSLGVEYAEFCEVAVC